MPDLRAWRQYWTMFEGLRLRLSIGAGLALMQALVVLPLPYILKELVDVLSSEQPDLRRIIELGLIMMALSLASTGVLLSSRYLLIGVVRTAISRLRRRLVRQLHDLPHLFHTGRDPGKLQSVVVTETSRLDASTSALLSDILPSFLGVVGFCAVLVSISPMLVLFTLLGYIPMLVITRIYSSIYKRAYQAFRETFQDFSAGVMRTLRRLPLLRNAGIQREDIDVRAREIEDTAEKHQRMAWYGTVSRAGHVNALKAGSVFVLLVGCWMILGGKLTGSELIAFYGGMALLNGQVTVLLNAIPTVIGADTTLAVIQELLDEDATPLYTGTREWTMQGRVDVEGLEFAYDPARPVLRGLDLHLTPGDLASLAGFSGEGKTTLLMLLLGVLKPSAGTIHFDGQNINELDIVHLRRQVGFVAQETQLITGTIRENIALEAPGATDEDVRAAARSALLADFVESLPEGYDTPVGEEGMKLSGGQRQRLALARALARKPRLLLLDEPTHGLDPRAARAVMRSLEALRGSCTILVITHDLELIRRTARIHVLEGGRIAAVGEWETLLADSDAFRRLVGLLETPDEQ
jgi:ABC-type bacteriocin/lantibiotic exporter with double-glycine peptidase domain